MRGWELGVHQLVAAMDNGYTLAKARGEATGESATKELDDGKARLEENAEKAATRLDAITKTVTALSTNVKALREALDQYSEALKVLQ